MSRTCRPCSQNGFEGYGLCFQSVFSDICIETFFAQYKESRGVYFIQFETFLCQIIVSTTASNERQLLKINGVLAFPFVFVCR